MKTINIRTDLLKTRGITALGKILLSYFSIVYYVAGDGFKFKIPVGAKTLGTTEKRLQTAISNLTSKRYISTFGSFEEGSVLVFMNKALLNKQYEGFLNENPNREQGDTEEKILEDMVRTARKKAGLSKHAYANPYTRSESR